jgi:hypothetical protein
MKTNLKQFQARMLFTFALAILSSLSLAATFTDANWLGMGGFAGANGPVKAVAADGAGNVYIAGNFTFVGNTAANRIAKWNGSSWSALGSGLDGTDNLYKPEVSVYALAVSGSDVYVGGFFDVAGGGPANYIAKWNGSTWTNLGSGMVNNPIVYALAVSGGDLYAGGQFTTAGGTQATNIAKWDGTTWTNLGSGIGAGADVYALAVSGSNVYAGGYFTTADGSSANYIAKWDGSSWSALGSGMNSQVQALAVLGGNLYAGGYFTTAGGNPANYVAKWDGLGWTGLDTGLSGAVYALSVSGSDLYAGGNFTNAGGSTANYIAKWNGSTWTNLGSGVNSNVSTLAVSGNNLYAGGAFTTAGGGVAQSIAKWDGSSWMLPRSGMLAMSGAVSGLAVSGNDVYAGGSFRAAGESNANLIAKWDGSSWSPLGSGMNGSPGHILYANLSPYLSALAASGANIYAGGYFTNAGGIVANYIAKWDGSGWSALGSGMDGGLYVFGDFYPPYVSALAVSGNDVYAGGWFMTAGGTQVNNVAKWNGRTWSALGLGIGSGQFGDHSEVFALAVSGNDLYVAGNFTTAGGTQATNIAKWDGSSWSALGPGVSSSVHALAVLGSDLYVGGNFTNAGGVTANYVAKWNGSNWSALGSGMSGPPQGPYPGVFALAVSGGDLYVGGNFTNAGGNTANYIAKWDGANWTMLGSGINSQVQALAVQGSDLYVGGTFATAGGKASAYVARAIINPPILAIEPDGFGGYFLRFEGVPGSAYRLQRAPGLSGPWATSGPQTAPASAQLEFWDVFPPPDQAFYRTVQE